MLAKDQVSKSVLALSVFTWSEIQVNILQVHVCALYTHCMDYASMIYRY